MMNKKLFIYIFLSLFIVSWSSNELLSQFLKDESRPETFDKKTSPSDTVNDSSFPDHIAFNIKASREPDRKNAVRISWEVNPGSKYEFIVGRHTEKIDTVDKVLKARPVDTLPSVARGVVVDDNLVSGSYYYVVVSKEKSRSREFELYPGVNYTITPVVISERQAEPQSSGSGIRAEQAGPNSVVVRWERLSATGVNYAVYRSGESINNLDRLNAAEKVGETVDVGQIIDRGISSPGRYFYAITARARGGAVDVVFNPDVTYMVQGVEVKQDQGVDKGLTGLIVRPVESGIRLDWYVESSGREIQGFAVYRNSRPINNYESLRRSDHVVTLDSGVDWYIDRRVKEGSSYYYAVVAKFNNGSVDLRLRNGINYSVEPVTPLPVSQVLPVVGFEVSYAAGLAELYWEINPDYEGERECLIFRKKTRPEKYLDIKRGDIIARVPLERESLQYRTDDSGYYYGIVPPAYRKNPDIRFENEINITDELPESRSDVERLKEPEENSGIISRENTGEEVDEILARTFFRGRYRTAVNELVRFGGGSSDPGIRAKVWLFTGRSYIELGQYDRAVRYLLRDDVVKHYPKESAFWRDFAYRRLR